MQAPSVSRNFDPCHGQVTTSSLTSPASSGPPAWLHVASIAYTRAPLRCSRSVRPLYGAPLVPPLGMSSSLLTAVQRSGPPTHALWSTISPRPKTSSPPRYADAVATAPPDQDSRR